MTPHRRGGSLHSNTGGNVEDLLLDQFLDIAHNTTTTKTMLPGDNASAIHICKIGILRQTPDAAPHNQKPWMYILDDSQELLQPGNTQIDGLIVWEQAEFFISIPLEAMASVIRPGGSLLVIEPPGNDLY